MAVWNVVNHTELGAGSATMIDVTSIPATYDHLYLVGSLRSDMAATEKTVAEIQVNGDTGTNYTTNFIYSGGGNNTPTGSKYTGYDSFDGIQIPAADCLADTFSSFEMWIYNYSNTTHLKQCLLLSAVPNNDPLEHKGSIMVAANVWASTAAIDRIKMFVGTDNFVQYSSMTIYGINGAA